MRRPGKISAALVGVSLIAIVLVWPSYKQEMRIKRLAVTAETQIIFSKVSFFRYNCGDGLNFNLNSTGRESNSRTWTALEKRQCREQRAQSRERTKIRYEMLLTSDGCFSTLKKKHRGDFTNDETSKACEIAIKRIKAKDKKWSLPL